MAPLLLLLLSLFLRKSLAESSPAVCNATQNPDFCNSVLPPGHPGANLYSYGRFSIARSLSQAKKFSRTIKKHLSNGRRRSLSHQAAGALEDCDLLSGLNVDFLQSTAEAVNASDSLLDPQAERAQTLLSALLTNQQTCLEGLQLAASAWSLRNELSSPISNDTKLFSLSLALFSRAWVRGKRKRAAAAGFVPAAALPLRRGLFSLSMSPRNRHLFEAAAGRRLLQAPSTQIFVKTVVVVSKTKKGNFSTIAAAVAAAPNNTASAAAGYYLIYVTAGLYQEYVEVPKTKKYVMMVGDGINRTIITGNRSVIDGWTTFNSATFAVVGQGFVAMNMTFRNTAGPAKHQAVALRNGADQSTFYRCSFEAYQDTLYTHSLRQFYRECDVYGTVDFIFGNAAAVFQACNIYARLPMRNQKNMVTAQGRTDPNQNTGTSIQGCRIMATPELARNGSGIRTFLGRPWKEYSRTIVMQSFLDRVVDPEGWMPWDGEFALKTLFYAEFNNTGPGAGKAGRVKWPGLRVINSTDALNFTVSGFIAGDKWLPGTGVSFLKGLN